MKKRLSFIVIVVFLSVFVSEKIYAQGCELPVADQSPDPVSPNYCEPVPLDENVVFLVVAVMAIGLYKLRKAKLTVQ